MHPVLNALGFQAAWWLCVFNVGRPIESWVLLACFAWAALQVGLSSAPRGEFKLALCGLLLGIVVDTALQASSVLQFHGIAWPPLSPLWLWALWVLLALTLNSSLAFLQRRPLWLSAVLGMLFGPLSYHAGALLGAADWAPSPLKLLTLALTWMVCLPLLVWAARVFFTSPKGNS